MYTAFPGSHSDVYLAGFDTPLGIAIIILGMLWRWLRYRHEPEPELSRGFWITIFLLFALPGGCYLYFKIAPPPARQWQTAKEVRAEWRARLQAETQAEYEALEKARLTLDVNDANAVNAFNERAAAYRQQAAKLQRALATPTPAKASTKAKKEPTRSGS